MKPARIPDELVARWQSMTELLVSLTGADGARVTRASREGLFVVAGAGTEQTGRTLPFVESGSGCESAIKSQDRVSIANPEHDPLWHELNPAWRKSPDLAAGLPGYLGYPIKMPHSGVYGSICVLGKKPQDFAPEVDMLLSEFRDTVESQLKLLADQTALKTHYTAMAEGVMLLDTRLLVREVNELFLNTWGIGRGGLDTTSLASVLSDMTRPALHPEAAKRSLLTLIEEQAPDPVVIPLASGAVVQCKAKRLEDELGNSWGTAVYCGTTEQASTSLSALCNHETCSLSTICSKEKLLELGNHEVERSVRYSKPLSFLLVELAGLAESIPDSLLEEMVARFRISARNLDVIGMVGGNRLGFLLPETDHSGAEALAERLVALAQNEPYTIDGHPIYLQATCGIAAWTREIGTLESLLVLAEASLSNATRPVQV